MIPNDRELVISTLKYIGIDFRIRDDGKFIEIESPSEKWGSSTVPNARVMGKAGLVASFCFDRKTGEFLIFSLNQKYV